MQLENKGHIQVKGQNDEKQRLILLFCARRTISPNFQGDKNYEKYA